MCRGLEVITSWSCAKDEEKGQCWFAHNTHFSCIAAKEDRYFYKKGFLSYCPFLHGSSGSLLCSCAQNLFVLHSIHVQTTLPLWRTVAVRNVGAKYWNMPHEISADSDTGSMSLLCTLFLTWKQTLLPPPPPLVLTFKEYLNVRQMSSCQGGWWLHCFPLYLYLDSPTQMEAKSTFFLRAWKNHTFKFLTNLEMINKHMTN